MSTDNKDSGPWKCGNEFLPFHPDASHVRPDYRDGWNRCYYAARSIAAGAAAATEGVKSVGELMELARQYAHAYFNHYTGSCSVQQLERFRATLESALAASPSMGSAGAMQQPVMTLERKQLIARQLVGDDSVSNVTALRIINAVLCDLGAFASPLGASAGDAGAYDWKAIALHYEAALRHLSQTAFASKDWRYARDALGSRATAARAEVAGDAGARMLTDDEVYDAFASPQTAENESPHWIERMNAVVRKAFEVNGIRLAGAAPAAAPAQQSDSVHSSAPGADVGKTLENAPGAGGSDA